MRPKPDVLAGVPATVLFHAFAYKNLGAIRDCTFTREAVPTTLKADARAATPGIADDAFRRNILPTLNPPAFPPIRRSHVACDGLTVVLLWGLQWRRWRASREAPGVVASAA